MTTETERHDEADEIYLTEDEFEHWFNQSTYEPDILLVQGVPLLLKNHSAPIPDPYGYSLGSRTLGLMCDRAFGKPEPDREPEPRVFKLPQPDGAVWTLFRTYYGVVAVNDNGNVVVWFTSLTLHGWKIRVTPEGTLACHGRRPYPEYIEMRQMNKTIHQVKSDIKAWVRRGHGRRTPQRMTQLLKHIAKTPSPDFLKDEDTGAWCSWPDEANCHVM